ncbi:uncharacterized protein [Antedon mediterranea]|uniref:uncharacterized protein n=1 Tax=Antedon mediterranea TaxID=105859 RepID=UPI003AF5A7F1
MKSLESYLVNKIIICIVIQKHNKPFVFTDSDNVTAENVVGSVLLVTGADGSNVVGSALGVTGADGSNVFGSVLIVTGADGSNVVGSALVVTGVDGSSVDGNVVNAPVVYSKDRRKEDTVYIDDVFNACQATGSTLSSVIRLGKREREGNKPRLLKVTVDSVATKRNILGGTKNLRDGKSDKWSNIYVTPDLTQKEREKNKLLRETLSFRRNEEGNESLAIRRDHNSSNDTSGSSDDTEDILRANKKDLNSKKKLYCVYTNVDGLINKKAELESYLSSKTDAPDILAITEVFPKRRSSDIDTTVLQLNGYDMFITDQLGRGVCIYTNKVLKATSVNFDTQVNNFNESVWCEIRLENEENILVGCIYRSPNSSKENNDALLELISTACRRKYPYLLITGDFNYREIDWTSWISRASENHGSSKLVDCLQDNFLYQVSNRNTRYRDGNRPSLLDLIIVNDELLIDEVSEYSPLGKSDHVILEFYLNCYCKIDDYQPNAIHEATSANIPKTKPKDGIKKKRKSAVWMNTEALAKIKKKYHAWKRYTATKHYKDYEKYTKLRNAASKESKKAKRIFEKKLAKEVKTNPKCFWNYVRSKTRIKCGISHLTKPDGSKTKNDEEKAFILNNFFCSTFTCEDISDVPELTNRYNGVPLSTLVFSREQVLKKLMSLNPSKSPGPDSIHPRVLKEAAELIADPLTNIFNKSIKEGIIPDDWKVAHVSAIFKKGNPTNPSNYRPISLTSVICKVMESLIRDDLMMFLEGNDLISNHQYGFRAGRSCVTQLIMVLDKWTAMIDEEGGVDVAYLDFSKAFDTVPHQRLLKKIQAYGINGNLLKWIECFLLGRKQRVAIKGTLSSWSHVTSGIPQGSVLGPILFLIYINDLPDILESHTEMFADDTKLFNHIKSRADCEALQRDIDAANDWAKTWQLQFNVNKCCIMHLGRNLELYNYTMSAEALQAKEEEKDLGVIFDQTLKFSKHVGIVSNRANRVVGLIRHTFNYLDEEMFVPLFKSLVRPHLEYANCVWSPFLRKDITCIEKVQRRETKAIPSLKDLDYTERLKRLNLPTLAFRRLRGDMIQVFKMVTGLSGSGMQLLTYGIVYQRKPLTPPQ